jgi:hypothetical protein
MPAFGLLNSVTDRIPPHPEPILTASSTTFPDERVVVKRRAQYVAEHVETQEGLLFYPEKSVLFRHDRDLAFPGLAPGRNTCAHESACKRMGGIVFVQLFIPYFQHEEVFLPEPLQVADVFLSDDVPLPERPPLELPGPNLCYVVSKDAAHRIFYRHRP